MNERMRTNRLTVMMMCAVALMAVFFILSAEPVHAATSVNVSDYSELSQAINDFNAGSGDTTIYLTQSITATSIFPAITKGDFSLTITSTSTGIYTITRGATGHLFTVSGNNVDVCMERITVDGNKTVAPYLSNAQGSLVRVEDGASLTLSSNATLRNNIYTTGATGYGGGVSVGGGGELIMTSGSEISGNQAYDGGGVYVNGGGFEMTGGTISDNQAVGSSPTGHGGGVSVYNGSFEMTGGKICINTATYRGGGVYVGDGGELTMTSGGEISGNEASDGGGVYVVWDGSFEMTGGKISGNNANHGHGGGVYVYDSSSSKFIVGGSAVVSGNELTPGALTNNAYLPTGRYITLSTTTPAGTLMKIHVSVPSPTIGAVIVNGGAIQSHAYNFEYDNPASDGNDYYIVHDGAGNLILSDTPPPQPPRPQTDTSGGRSGAQSSYATGYIFVGEEKVRVDYRMDGSGLLTTYLTDDLTDDIIEGMEEGSPVIFDLTGVKGVKTVRFSSDAIDAFADAGLGIELKLPFGTITFDDGALSSLSGAGGNVDITFRPVDTSELSDEQQNAVNSGDIIIDITVTSGGKQISEFDGTITVSVPYEGELPVAVWYLNDDGELQKVECTYDEVTGTVTFTTDHLSLYLIGFDDTPVPDIPGAKFFVDITDDAWYYEHVMYAYESGMMNGTGTDPMTFSPDASLTRGMLVTILYNMEKRPSVTGLDNPFTDVSPDKWYADAVIWASSEGIASGANARFNPEAFITREDFAVILYQYAEYKGIDVSPGEDSNILSYNDATDISEYAIEAMQWVCAEGIMTGKPGGLLDPKGSATRAQAASMLHNFAISGYMF